MWTPQLSDFWCALDRVWGEGAALGGWGGIGEPEDANPHAEGTSARTRNDDVQRGQASACVVP